MSSSCLILMYHVVDDPQSAIERQWCCPVAQFDEQMRGLREEGYSPVTMDQVARSITGQYVLPPKAVCVTFDDGTRCFLDNAMPILQRYRIPATLYVVAGLQGRTNEWLANSGFPQREMLSGSELRSMTAKTGVTIGSHTMFHPNLLTLTEDQLNYEVTHSKRVLEDNQGSAVDHFAYPFGRLNRRAYRAVRNAGYASAVTANPGRNRAGDDLHLLRRVEIYNWDSIGDFRWKLRLGNNNARFDIKTMKTLTKKFLAASGVRREDQFEES